MISTRNGENKERGRKEVGEVEKETSPPRQPKRADETPPTTPQKPAQPLSKPPSIAKPHSDPYENEDEDPATAALRREIRETSNHSFHLLICCTPQVWHDNSRKYQGNVFDLLISNMKFIKER